MSRKDDKVAELDKWLADFRDDSPYADVNIMGESEDYVRGFREGIDWERYS